MLTDMKLMHYKELKFFFFFFIVVLNVPNKWSVPYGIAGTWDQNYCLHTVFIITHAQILP